METLKSEGDTATVRTLHPTRPRVRLIHEDCGEISEAHPVCSACGKRVGPLDFTAIPGPGAVEPLVRVA
jgi:hypothetical protein